jgi:hypothetical protein
MVECTARARVVEGLGAQVRRVDGRIRVGEGVEVGAREYAMIDRGIKGTLFAGVVDDFDRLRDQGRISEDLMEAHLDASDRRLLEEKVSPTTWYDIEAYHRIVHLLRDAEGGAGQAYWFERGRRAARRLIEMGIYQQLDYLGRTEASRERDPAARFRAFGRDMKLLLTLQASMMNFGDWKCVPDPDHPRRYRVELRGVEGVPDGIFVAASGMFTVLAEQSRGSVSWSFERVSPDFVLIRMAEDL